MCLNKRAQRSLAAHKGWETRRAREEARRLKHPIPSEGWATSKSRALADEYLRWAESLRRLSRDVLDPDTLMPFKDS